MISFAGSVCLATERTASAVASHRPSVYAQIRALIEGGRGKGSSCPGRRNEVAASAPGPADCVVPMSALCAASGASFAFAETKLPSVSAAFLRRGAYRKTLAGDAALATGSVLPGTQVRASPEITGIER
jgi:hypothetical protein